MQQKIQHPKRLAMGIALLAGAALCAGVFFFLPGWFQIGYHPVNPAPIQQQELLRVNLNTATPQQLQVLDGLGEKTAAAIVEYRNRHGAFKSIEELKNIAGIGEKKVNKWAPYIYIE